MTTGDELLVCERTMIHLYVINKQTDILFRTSIIIFNILDSQAKYCLFNKGLNKSRIGPNSNDYCTMLMCNRPPLSVQAYKAHYIPTHPIQLALDVNSS